MEPPSFLYTPCTRHCEAYIGPPMGGPTRPEDISLFLTHPPILEPSFRPLLKREPFITRLRTDPSVRSSRKDKHDLWSRSDSLLHPRTRRATCRVCERGISIPSPALVLFLILAFTSLYSGLRFCFQSSSISSIQRRISRLTRLHM